MAGHWSTQAETDVLSRLRSRLDHGLSSGEAEERRGECGLNLIEEGKPRSSLAILVAQFSDFLVIILLASAGIAAWLGEPQDAIAIFVIVALNACLGFIQEWRAEKTITALKSLASPRAQVRRGGHIVSLPAFELVPGDIVLLEAGNLIPADVRILESADFSVDESMLTGESQAVVKTTGKVDHQLPGVADQTNMAFKGTMASSGRAVGVVAETGMRTELGKIARLLREEIEVKTPLQMRLARFAKYLALVVFLLCATIFVAGLLRGEDPVLIFMTSLSLAVAAIPESLPAVVTVALAVGARNMGRRRALVRRLPAVEALGSVTYICTDKTGTLTENKMRVERIHVGGETLHLEEGWTQSVERILSSSPRSQLTARELALQIIAQSNDAFMEATGIARGEPTEAALLSAAREAGISKTELERVFPRIAEFPFSSERAMMSTIHQGHEECVVFAKGAPETILSLCQSEFGSIGLFSPENLQAEAARMAGEGLRVLAIAFRKMPLEAARLGAFESAETNLIFVGFVGLIDPPRAEVFDAIRSCQSAGIRVVMITGDHPATALAIGRRLGLVGETTELGMLMTGSQLSLMSDVELQQRIKEVAIFARVAPEQKIRIVKALQSAGEIAAMTGDGVNDAPALKRADIGVAMGIAGTDVAREASHMILLDDNFATIVNAVREGRRIYDNVRKFVRFALSGNSGEIWPIFLAPFMGLPTPLLPIQILWINLVTDGLPGLALAFEPEERDLMRRGPRDPRESIFARGLWQHTLWVGALTGALTLGVQVWAISSGRTAWQTMAFTVLTITQMGHVLAIRSERDSLFQIGLLSNPLLFASVLLTFALHLAILYVPQLNAIMKTEPLSLADLLICLVVSTTAFIAVEIEKAIKRRR